MTTERDFDAIHEAAMELSSAADAARAAGNGAAAQAIYYAAMALECEALPMTQFGTTSHFVMSRSAAHLAMMAGDYVRAASLAKMGHQGVMRSSSPIEGRANLLMDIYRSAVRAQVGRHAGDARSRLRSYVVDGADAHPHDGALVAAIDAWHEAEAAMLAEADRPAEEDGADCPP